jgi:hypothetical protein
MAYDIHATAVTHSMLCISVGIVNAKSCISNANSLQTISQQYIHSQAQNSSLHVGTP